MKKPVWTLILVVILLSGCMSGPVRYRTFGDWRYGTVEFTKRARPALKALAAPGGLITDVAIVAADTVATPFYAIPVAYRSTSSFADDPKGLERAAFFVLVHPGWTLYLGYGGSSPRTIGEPGRLLKKMDARAAAKKAKTPKKAP